MQKREVLVAISSARFLELRNGNTVPTGYFLNELVIPLLSMMKAGLEPVFATPDGLPPVIDPLSDSPAWFGWRFRSYCSARRLALELEALQKPCSLEDVIDEGLDEFSAIFIPGGHGAKMDLASSAAMGHILGRFHENKRIIGAIGHGTQALLSTLKDPERLIQASEEGQHKLASRLAAGWPFEGYKMTTFSPIEERLAEAARLLRWRKRGLPYDGARALRSAGAQVETSLAGCLRYDRELITSQGPFAAKGFAKAFVTTLLETQRKKRKRTKPARHAA